MTIYSRS